ncbi:hypothetical protein Pla123a_06080 [Posidoniimonas polymericola]|uniref:Tetratricopeptide repeat protein n=1 Tax=Posidoniimonas polymericola TaxID=2528002 RepID=A0A5C5ZG09_9BACT|nr:tetratricopeptide repeat protein [Posidoniimonas polymericola]TWT85801.1 hypothetical protein Pla123a_06080 [Posidoniimonas polymericola]
MPALEQTLFGLLVCGVVIVAILLLILVRLQQLLEMNRRRPRSAVEQAIERGDFEEIIRRAQKQLEQTPHHTRARWSLAKAYFAKEMWAEAKAEFETIGRNDPSWRVKFTEPYLDEIEKRQAG